MPAGWNVRVTTFDSEGKPGSVRYFLAYEPDKERAVELVRNCPTCSSKAEPRGGGSFLSSDKFLGLLGRAPRRSSAGFRHLWWAAVGRASWRDTHATATCSGGRVSV